MANVLEIGWLGVMLLGLFYGYRANRIAHDDFNALVREGRNGASMFVARWQIEISVSRVLFFALNTLAGLTVVLFDSSSATRALTLGCLLLAGLVEVVRAVSDINQRRALDILLRKVP